MTVASSEQRNPYKGSPRRPWFRLRLTAPDDSTVELDLVADTGNPLAIIISRQPMARLKAADAPDANTNFGLLEGGLLQLAMPELGLAQLTEGYSSDAVVAAAKASHPDFEGLAGLPLLRLAEYGGDADWFWVRKVGGPNPP
jgi:hypothetical protein